MRIAVAGGTGLIGHLVVDELRSRGHTTVVLARSVGVDLVTGAGLDHALDGAEALIDVSNIVTTRRTTAIEFFGTATRTLLAGCQRAGVQHHVVLSIVGVDRVPWGYYQGKRHQEQLAIEGPVPATVLRATQLHEFADQLLQRAGPLVLVPAMLSQPIAAGEVARALTALIDAGPQGLAPELAGPERLRMLDMVRGLARARQVRRPVVAVRLPGQAGRTMAQGGLLPRDEGPRGVQTFAQWLTTIGAAAEGSDVR